MSPEGHEWRSRDEIWGCILLSQEQKVQAMAELERRQAGLVPSAPAAPPLSAQTLNVPLQPRASSEPRVMTADEAIAETWREVKEWKRKNLWRCDTRRRIRVPIPR